MSARDRIKRYPEHLMQIEELKQIIQQNEALREFSLQPDLETCCAFLNLFEKKCPHPTKPVMLEHVIVLANEPPE